MTHALPRTPAVSAVRTIAAVAVGALLTAPALAQTALDRFDGDGLLAPDELAEALRITWDVDDDGALSVDEWDAGVDRWFGEEEVDLAVATWDRDGDGTVSEAELALALEETGLFAGLDADGDALQSAFAAMTERPQALAEDIRAAEEQRDAVQEIVTQLTQDLSARSEQLAQLEQRIAEMQAQGASSAAPAASAGGPLEPGRYRVGPVLANFAGDGTFQMLGADGRESVGGDYDVSDGVLTLRDMSGDVRQAVYPMRCAIAEAPAGFLRLRDTDGSCAPFDGLVFERQE